MEDRRSACVNALPSGRPWLDHNCATRSRCMPFTSSVVASLYRCEAVRMCACHGLEWGERDVTANPKPSGVKTPSRLAPVHPGLKTGLRSQFDPGTGLAQRDRSQGLPACEEASAPPQGGALS
jgi:hypothetical protein